MNRTTNPSAAGTRVTNNINGGFRANVTGGRSHDTMNSEQMVVVLDDDRGVRTGLERLLVAHGFRVRLHTEANGLFRDGLPTVPSCLLLDNQLGEGMTGVEVHEELLHRDWFIPTVFLAGDWNVRLVVNAMRAGVDSLLAKPFDPTEVVDAVASALQRSRDRQQDDTTRVRRVNLKFGCDRIHRAGDRRATLHSLNPF